ncbi:MAG TPA: serine/threonine-protein kinase, partial [Methylomirabilota bacterium]|nr:serine/threonine-protein kinase [Methylomirabilota bacterium]
MSTKIGHFEILSELAKSSTGAVYKANDPESGQTVALKAIQLSAFGEKAGDLEQALLQEADSTKCLSSSNITPVFGAGEIEGQFCAAMEYVQGNSIATMLTRREGFSIWDLLDIGRQVCGGLDHAHSNQVFHYSLEPAKIMCGWDGTVKILGFGVSSVGKFTESMPAGVPAILHYMSPEQIRGEAIDARSNLFSLGAMFYEMVTDKKAFDRPDAANLRQCILESAPVPPVQVNPKLHPLLSNLIMKALEKDPAKRYQRGRELLDDLEKCKESRPQAAKKPAGAAAAGPVKAAAQAKFAAPAAPQKPAAPAAQKVAPRPAAPVAPAAARPPEPKAPAPKPEKKFNVAPAPAEPVQAHAKAEQPAPKAAAAAAGWGGETTSSVSPELDLSDSYNTPVVEPTIESSSKPSAYMSSAVADEPSVETFEPSSHGADAPKIAVDPLMSEGGQSSGGASASFSEISELPPLKEVYVEPPPPPPLPSAAQPAAAPSAPTVFEPELKKKEEKPRVQPREVAEKAIKEIKGVPPRLVLYSIAGAVALILIIAAAVAYHIHSQNSGDDDGAARPVATEETPAPSQPAPNVPAAAETPAPAPAAPVAESSQPEPPRESAAASSRRNAKKKTPPPAPAVVPGQIAVDSTPQGALFQIDGKGDPSWVTPLTVSGLLPGQHSITVSKGGYSTDTRNVTVASGTKSSLVIHLSQLMATLSVTSNPAGANVFVDARDTGKTTPAQLNLDKGLHTVLVRKAGYIDETTTTQFALGQATSFAATLRPMGNVDSIKTVGKMKKLF